jgi:hypothetical protein
MKETNRGFRKFSNSPENLHDITNTKFETETFQNHE